MGEADPKQPAGGEPSGGGDGGGSAGGAAGAGGGGEGFQPQGFRGTSTGAPIGAGGGGAAPDGAGTGGQPSGSQGAGGQPAKGGEGGQPRQPTTVDDLGGEGSETLKARLEREHRKLYRELLGTENPEEAKKKLEEMKALDKRLEEQNERLKKYEAAEEKRKREQMTEEQKLKADLERQRKEAEEWKKRFEEQKTEILYQRQDTTITSIAQEYVDPKLLKYAKRELAEHTTSLPKDKLAKFGERDIKRFFEKFVKDNPHFAKKAETPAEPKKEEEPKPPVRKPITTGPKPEKAPAKPASRTDDGTGGKTFRPGQPNSMSKAEVREAARKQGIRWPG